MKHEKSYSDTRSSASSHEGGGNLYTPNSGKILLLALPFWSPLIPPMGISCLKSFLRQNGYDVKTDDANVREEFKAIYNQYFNTVKENVPVKKRGNFYSIGQDVLHNHLMAQINYRDEAKYVELVKVLLYQTFYTYLPDIIIEKLNTIIGRFYVQLEKYILHLLEEVQPSILGLSVCSGVLPASLFAFKKVKEYYPHIKTVMGGGIFCDQLAEDASNFETFLQETQPYIDKIIIGEGEILFLKWLQGELPESQRVYSIKNTRPEALDISAVNVPDFTDFHLKFYPYLSAYTSRSCPFQCSFCSDAVMWGKYRKKSGRQVAGELVELYKRHGHQLFLLSDLLLNPILTDLSKELIKSEIAVYWDGCVRADPHVCDTDNTFLWRQGGFFKGRIGCESGSNRVLRLMKKNITIEQTKKAIASLAFAGIQVTAFWVIGFPGETEEDFRMTLDAIEEIREDIYEAECRPFYYYLTGQVNSDDWAGQYRHKSLYPGEYDDMLLLKTWILDALPSREETYERVSRFVEHCNRLGIPNTYNMQEIYEADRRWKKLHENAVPAILDFSREDSYIDECKSLKRLSLIQYEADDGGEFEF